jgi:hypothetical protein
VELGHDFIEVRAVACFDPQLVLRQFAKLIDALSHDADILTQRDARAAYSVPVSATPAPARP